MGLGVGEMDGEEWVRVGKWRGGEEQAGGNMDEGMG